MGSNGTHKNKTYLSKKKIQICIFALESAFEKIGSPPYSQKLKSLFMVVNRSALVPRNQRNKPSELRLRSNEQ